MSYILDALKKSESERRAAAAPGLAGGASFILAPQSRPRHRGTAVILGIGMLATGLALGNWRAWHGVPVAVAPAPVQLAAQMPELPAALPGEPKAPAAAAKKVVTAEKEAVAADREAVTAEKKAVAAAPKKKPASRANAAPARTPQVAAAAGRPAGTALPVASVAPAAAATPPVAARAAAQPHTPPVVAAAPVAAPAAAAPADRVLAYRELPPAVQGALPTIVFGGFAGGNEGEAKMAFINSRLVREGEDLSPGLKLEAVNQDGAVFAYQGYRFRAAN